MARLHILQVTELTLSDVAAGVAAGAFTPSDVVEAYLARIDAVEDRVQAWSDLDREGARAQAAALTAEAAGGRLWGPLHGVPIGIKDQFHVAGKVTQKASLQGPPRPEDATAVARLRAAGAVIMGKTYMPIDERRQPPTRNPWNLEHTPGGTSSGSGAAVGARMVPLALAEQTAGSGLRPAAYCGVDALKPTYGRISRFGLYPINWSHDHVGIIGLTMADIALVFSVIGGPDARDPSSRPEPPPMPDLSLSTIRPQRIGIIRNFFPERTEPEMLAAIEDSAERLKAAGARLVDVLLPRDFGMTWNVHRLIAGAEHFAFRSRHYFEADASVPASDRAASLVPSAYYLHAQRIRRHLWNELRESFADVAVLLMGAAPGGAPKGLKSTGSAQLLVPWSCLGYPAITINGGLSLGGLPLGLQLVALPMADYELMRAGAWAEAVLGRLPAPALDGGHR